MADTVLISVFCADRPGLVGSIAGALFDLGANLGDTNFAVLGTGAEFSSVCDLPDGVSVAAVEADLARVPELIGAEIAVRPFTLDPDHGPSGDVTHRIVITGGDQPGLIARLCETFVEFGANIVTLNAGRPTGERAGQYVIRLNVWIPDLSADACLATVANTAQHLQLACAWERA